MVGEIIEVKQLSRSEKGLLKRLMRKEQGAVTKMAKSMNLPRQRIYDGINDKPLAVNTLNAIRTFLKSQKAAA